MDAVVQNFIAWSELITSYRRSFETIFPTAIDMYCSKIITHHYFERRRKSSETLKNATILGIQSR